MVRFQPPSLGADADDGMDTSSASSGSDGEQGGRGGKARGSRVAAGASHQPRAADSDDSSDDEVQLPLRGRTPNVKATPAALLDERRAAREEEMKYPLEGRRARPAGEDPADAARRHAARGHASPVRGKLHYMAETLLDEEEEQRALEEEEAEQEALRLEQETEAEAATAALEHGVFAPPPVHTQRLQRPVPVSALSNFLAALPRYVRPARASEYQRNNPLAPAAASTAPGVSVAAAASSRSVLDFHRHSFRAGWSSQGNMLVFAGGIDGRSIVQAHVDAMAVDANAQRDAGPVATIEPVTSVRAPSQEAAANHARVQKRRFIESCLETHLNFHSLGAPTPQQPSLAAPNGGLLSSARMFGAVDAAATATAPFGATGAFSFGQTPATPVLTPFTRLCDAYIDAIKSLLAAQSSFVVPSAPASSVTSELELSLSAFQLLRSLYSKEEGEQRAPKLSRSMEAQLRAGTVAASGDLSVLTAQSDPYSLELGREAAFEQGWLRPTVTASYVSKRVRQLQSAGVASLQGSDGVSGTKLQEVLAYLIGHDVTRATDACMSIGDFRLATLVSQVGSYNSSGPLDDEGRPALQSSADDLARQWSLWSSKDRGMSAFIPQDLHAIFRLLSGDVLIDPSLNWTEALALRYWYSQPQAHNATIALALRNYKQHAFAPSQRVQVRKPYPAYASYVPVAERRGGVRGAAVAAQDERGVMEGDDDDDDDMDGATGSQTLVVRSSSSGGVSSASSPSGVEFYDLRYGLLDLYTQQARSVNLVLSPQSHVPHVLDHHVAWHVFTTMQFTPVSEFGPHLQSFYMSYIYQLELLSASDDGASSSDLWKWAVYVALASPVPSQQQQGMAEFDREKIVKVILLRHVSYDRTNPFALPAVPASSALLNPALALLPGGGVDSYAAAADKSQLPASLPILRADATGNFFSVSLSVDQSVAMGGSTARSASSSATESFLIGRLQLPVAWLHECKAVRALAAHDHAVACFHHLHAGDVTSAYALWQERLRDPWILAVINRAEQGNEREPQGTDAALDQTLMQLLRYFMAHKRVLHGWDQSGALVLSYLEFRTQFAANVQHFTHAEGDLQDRAARIANFRQYRAELQQFLHALDRVQGEGAQVGSEAAAVAAVTAGVAEPALAVLAFSKMSGSILALLHALQPLVEEMDAEESRYGAAAGGHDAAQKAAEAAVQHTVDVSAGELVSSADRLAVLTDWKDQWLQQFNAPQVVTSH